MKIRVVVQVHPDGQKNVCLSQDPFVNLEDLIVRGNGWEKATIHRGEVILIGEQDIIQHILDVELRSVENALDITSCNVPDDRIFDIRLLLEKTQ